MDSPGTYTIQEILSQPQVWAETVAAFQAQTKTLSRFWERLGAEYVIFTGCGSTYYLSLTAAALFQSLTGVPCIARPASEVLYFPERVFQSSKNTLLVTISRSGTTTETVAALNTYRQYTQGHVLVITCDSRSPLAQNADFVLAADTAQEKSVAQTRSFTSMALLAQGLAGLLGSREVLPALTKAPQLLQQLMDGAHDFARQVGQDPNIDRFFFLGAGYLYGIACEAMLKMKEMSLSYSEAFHPMEFRHGPMSMVDERSLVVGLVSPETAYQERAVLRQMSGLGGKTLAISQSALPEAPTDGASILLVPALPGWAIPVMYLPPLQLVAYYHALSRSQNPDRPHNLTAVVQLAELK